MNTSVNDHFFPSFIESRTGLLILARFVSLFLETGVWLAATYAINQYLVRLIGATSNPRKIAAYIFFCEFGFVVGLIGLFFYNVFWLNW